MAQRTRRIGAYGLCRDDAGRVLLTHNSPRSAFAGRWQLPGGGVEHGEDPAAAVVREVAEETGLRVAVTGLRTVLADVHRLPGHGVLEHTDRVVYDLASRGGQLRDEVAGTTDRVAWFNPAEAAAAPMMPFTAAVLGLAPRPLPDPASAPDAGRRAGVEPAEAVPPAAVAEVATRPATGRRFSAYGLVTDPAGRVLLTLIADGYPGAGRWHLPGGGTDHGEQPDAALRREVLEESGQLGRITGLLEVSHRHDPAARGPEGYPIDWHVVRVLFRMVVDQPTDPVVTEAAGGSTLRAAWFAPTRTATLPTTEVAGTALRRLASAGERASDSRR